MPDKSMATAGGVGITTLAIAAAEREVGDSLAKELGDYFPLIRDLTNVAGRLLTK